MLTLLEWLKTLSTDRLIIYKIATNETSAHMILQELHKYGLLAFDHLTTSDQITLIKIYYATVIA